MSLVELCLTVAIISAATMIAVPSLVHGHEDYVLSATARRVAGELQSARLRAINGNQDCRLRVASESSFIVECLASMWITIESVALPAGFSIAGNGSPRFHRLGNVSPAATITIWNSVGRQRRVIVNVAGRVRVE